MNMMDDSINRMQQHLGLLRMCMGMTQEQFGEELGMSRQQVWNLEHGKNHFTKVYYMAIKWLYYQKESRMGGHVEKEAGKFSLARMVYDFVILNPELFNGDKEYEDIVDLLYSVAPLYLRAKDHIGRKMIIDGFCRELVAKGYDDFYDDL